MGVTAELVGDPTADLVSDPLVVSGGGYSSALVVDPTSEIDEDAESPFLAVSLTGFVYVLIARTAFRVSFNTAPAAKCSWRYRIGTSGPFNPWVGLHTDYRSSHVSHEMTGAGIVDSAVVQWQLRLQPDGGEREVHPSLGIQVYQVTMGTVSGPGSDDGIVDGDD